MKKFANDGCFDPEQLGPVSENTLRAGQIFRWAKISGTFGLVYHQPSATSGLYQNLGLYRQQNTRI